MQLNRKPYVSVVIPTYNRADYIAESIQSVLNQRLSKNQTLEVIVVDDGSTDNTAEVVKKFRKKVRYIKLDHSGIPATVRNIGISQARGELVAFQDSDDIWLNTKLAHQLPFFKDREVVLCYSNARVMEPSGQVTNQLIVDPAKLKSGYIFKDLTKENFVSTLTVVVRKSVLDAVGGFDQSVNLRAIEDYELWLRIAGLKLGRFKAIKKPLVNYRRHALNISSASNIQALARIESVLNKVWERQSSNMSRAYCLALVESMITTQENWNRAKSTEDPYTHPAISVVMSVYNGGKFLRPAIQSILNQTFSNFEFIIIDDGSTDDTASIIRSFNDSRIRLVQQPNQGLVRSLNEGIRIARAPFIARMDADDISLPSRLEKELRVLSSNPRIGLIGTFFTYIDERADTASTTITAPIKPIDLRRSFYIVNHFGHSSTLFRKEALEQVGSYRDDYGPTEDFELWRRIADHWEVRIIPESLHLYRLSSTSISHTKRKIQHKFTAKIIQEQWQKPFVYKSYKAIIKDGHYYRRLISPFAETIYWQYINEQFVIAMELFARGHFKTGLVNALAACRLDRQLWRRLWRPAIGGFLRRVGLRERKK